jgi:hypothetical protein
LKLKNQHLEECEQDVARSQQDKEQLRQYMQSVLEEPFGKSSKRLQSYVKKQLEQKPKPAAIKSSHNRLGFGGHSYTALDLLGNNDILSLHGKQMALELK